MWEKFQLHELFGIVQQGSDPDFAQLLNRVGEGQQTDNDAIQIKDLANTDTATWTDELVEVYCNNYLVGQENKDCIGKLDSEFMMLRLKKVHVPTNTRSISIPDNTGLSQTVNLPVQLK